MKPGQETIPKKESQIRIALEVCRRFERLYAMGINDVLPGWMHPSMDELYDLAEKALEGNANCDAAVGVGHPRIVMPFES